MDLHVEIAAEKLFKIGPLAVTNSMLMMFIVMALIIIGFWLVARNMREVPGRWQGLLEMIVGFILGIVEGTAGRKASRQLIPLVGGMIAGIVVTLLSLTQGWQTAAVYAICYFAYLQFEG